MKLDDAKKTINTLMNENWKVKGKTYNLNKLTWTFKGFDRSVRRLGACYSTKEISLSKKMTENRTKEEVKTTIIHEIAHAIDIEIRGYSNHDEHWKMVAIEIGHSGNRVSVLSEETISKTYKWVAVCPTHGVLGGWARKPSKGKICTRCGNKVKIEERNA